MNAKRSHKPLRLAEGADETPHYHGHRERLRQRLVDAGADSLPDYELLEIILFAANPRTDMKPLAKSLLARFGGFAELLSAESDALTAAGLGLAGIAALKAAREAALRLMRAELLERPVVNSWDKLLDYCTAQIAHGKVEEFHVLFLDRKNVLIKHERQQRGPSIIRRFIPAKSSSATSVLFEASGSQDRGSNGVRCGGPARRVR